MKVRLDMADISELLKSSKIDFIPNYDLSFASTFRIGGKALLATFPKTSEELIQIISISNNNNIKFEIVGNGSNILFSDNGYNGIIIITKKINKIELKDNKIYACCGAKLANLSTLAKNNSLSGLEFAAGIPGTLGGAVVMNAGAYGGQISDTVISSVALDIQTNKIISLNSHEHNFGYRESIYSRNKNLICLSAELQLIHLEKEKIEEVIKINSESRRQHQPLEYPNCGSFFKRPEGYFAAKLIDDCSLKGLSVGGAQVSTKHAGFIINTGNATADDVLKLAEIIKNTVAEKFGVLLENEVKYVY